MKNQEKENKEEEVFINIGPREFKEKFKPVRGTRLMLKVSNRASTKTLFSLLKRNSKFIMVTSFMKERSMSFCMKVEWRPSFFQLSAVKAWLS